MDWQSGDIFREYDEDFEGYTGGKAGISGDGEQTLLETAMDRRESHLLD